MPVPTATRSKVFCVPGRDESFAEAFGGLMWTQPVDIGHVDLTGPFARLRFSEQVDTVHGLIRQQYWSREALLLGRSFGAWILLHALMQLEESFPGTVVLLSAVLGYGQHRGLHFIAPRAATFWEYAASHARAPARHLALLHAADDTQCPVDYAKELRRLWPLELVLFEHGGHDIGKRTLQDDVSAAIGTIWSGQVPDDGTP